MSAARNTREKPALWRYIETAQREQYNMTTAYAAYRKAGGSVSPGAFRSLWRLAKVNPFHWNLTQ